MQDDITYEEPATNLPCPPITDEANAQWGFTGGCLTQARWKDLANFAKDNNAKLVFGLNGLRGRTHVEGKKWTGAWDPSNTKSLLEYTKENDLPIYAWELGNELGGWNGIQAQLSAQEVGTDFVTLRNLVTAIWGPDGQEGVPKIVGPDTGFDKDWFPGFFDVVKGKIDGLAIHMYALGAGVDPTLKTKIIDPKGAHIATALETAKGLKDLVNEKLGGSLPGGATPELWMGEDGGAYNSGQNGTTNRFTAGFWSLNELGIFAKNGFSTYCRQTLLGGNYGLLDKDTLTPNPDFFNYLLFKKLMGSKVLDVGSSYGDLFAFAHCTKADVEGIKPGAVTVLLINYNQDNDVQIATLKLKQSDVDLLKAPRQDYTLTPGTAGVLNSTVSNLNGKPLVVTNNVFPALDPQISKDGEALILPKTSYGFYVFPEAGVKACE